MREAVSNFEEIQREHRNRLATLLDLPLVVWMLNRIRRVWVDLKNDKERAELVASCGALKSRGEALSRRRALFVAAEAAGQISPEVLVEERVKLLRNLGVLVEEGNSLHKVRALRAMRFIASDECLPILDAALRDHSSWVKATAIRTLFRLNLRQQQARTVVRGLLWRSFRATISLGWVSRFLREFAWAFIVGELLGRRMPFRAESDAGRYGIFTIVRGLLAGLWRERGGRRLALEALILAVIGLVWRVISGTVISVAMYLAVCVLLFVLFPAMAYSRRFSAGQWLAPGSQAVLNYLTLVVAVVPRQQLSGGWKLMVLAIALTSILTVRSLRPSKPREDVALCFRGLVLAAVAWAKMPHGTDPVAVLVLVLVSMGIIWTMLKYMAPVLAWLHRNLWLRMKESLLAVAGVVAGIAAFVLLVVPLFTALIVGGIVAAWFRLSLIYVQFFRIALMARRHAHFRDFSDYLAYVIAVARDRDAPERARIRAVLRLAEFPLADPRIIQQLQDLADEDLAPGVKDAIYQVVDSAEKRVLRGQPSTVGLDISALLTRPAPAVSPGAFFRPWITTALLALAASVAGMSLLGMTSGGGAGTASTGELWWVGLAAFLLLCGALLAGRRSELHLVSLAVPVGLLAIVWSYPIQDQIVKKDLDSFPLSFMDVSAIVAVAYAIGMGLTGGIAGYALYVLDSDAPVKSGSGMVVGLTLTGLALVSIGRCPAVRDYIDHWREPLPRVLPSGSGRWRLEGVPQDGRMIRLALVLANAAGKNPELQETFPVVATAKARKVGLPQWEAKPVAAVLKSDPVLRGEVWVAAEVGLPHEWQNLPNGCLAVDSVGRGQVGLSIDSGCQDWRRLRLLILVYNGRRSGRVRRLASPDSAAELLRHPGRERLLDNTLSFFVTPVWGAPLPAAVH